MAAASPLRGLQAEVMLADRSGIRVIVTSGYNVEMFGKALNRKDGLTFIQKPYHSQQLLRCVRDSLDNR